MPRSRPAPFPDPASGGLGARLHAARALASRHRRLAAAVCAGAAVLAAVSALAPTAPAPASGDAAVADLSPVVLPSGAGAGSVAGARRVAITVRLADPAGTLLLRPGIHVEVIGGTPVGSAGAGAGEDAAVLAADAVVLVVPQPSGDAGDAGSLLDGGGGGSATSRTGLDGVAVLSVAPAEAHRLAAAAGTRPLSVTVGLPAP